MGQKEQLGQENGRNTQGEFPVLGFVAEGVHTQQHTHAAAQGSHTQQGALRDAPAFFWGFFLVQAHKQKACRIHWKQIDIGKQSYHSFQEGIVMQWIGVVLALLLLTGCQVREWETVADVYETQPLPVAGELILAMPEAEGLTVLEQGTETLYFCDGYTLTTNRTIAGDVNGTLAAVTGRSRENLTVVKTRRHGLDRYETVWASAGEGGDLVARALILDDGNYHYIITVMAPAEDAGNLGEEWQKLLDSAQLSY